MSCIKRLNNEGGRGFTKSYGEDFEILFLVKSNGDLFAIVVSCTCLRKFESKCLKVFAQEHPLKILLKDSQIQVYRKHKNKQ